MLRIWQKTEKQKLEPVGMGTAFPFLKEKNHVVSIIGGGGKTTLLYEMAGFCVKNDQKVLVTTSTHIYRPPKEWHDQSLEAVERKFRTGRAAIIGSACRDPEKLSMPETELFEAARKKADLTLIEADGARHLQCKAPAEHEPVLLSSSDLVIGVTGLSALGQPLGKGCFRAERAAELLGSVMFVIALAAGWNSLMVSSWKLLISATVTVSSVVSSAADVYGVPMFPTTFTSG